MKLSHCSPCLLLAALACQPIDSKNVKTAGIYADLRATNDDLRTAVTATLRAGGRGSATTLDLSQGDRLVAYAGIESQAMTRLEMLGLVSYEASFLPQAGGTELRVDFAREDQDGGLLGAPDSRVVLPPPLSITAPAREHTWSRATEELAFQWTPDPADDAMSFALSGSCILRTSGALIPGSGEHRLPPGAVSALGDKNLGESCPVVLEILRTRGGKVDEAYGEGGAFIAVQRRELELRSTP